MTASIPGAVRRALSRVRAFFRKPPLDADLEAEIAAHLEMAMRKTCSTASLPLKPAALRSFVLAASIWRKIRQREARGLMKLDILLQTPIHLRTLSRDRGFTTVAMLILALGIGADIAVFSVVNTFFLLAPAAFPQIAQQVVRIARRIPKPANPYRLTPPTRTQHFQQQNRSFQSVSGYFAFTVPTISSSSGTASQCPATGMLVAEGFFETLASSPPPAACSGRRNLSITRSPQPC